jgi:hypothetical protein
MGPPSVRALFCIAAALLIPLVGCGDDDDTPAEGNGATTDAATTDAATTDGADADEAAEVTTTVTVLPPGDADPAFCREVDERLQQLDEMREGSTASPAGDDDLRRQAGELFEDVEPPDEVAPDWELLMEPLTGPPPEMPDPDDPEAFEAFADQQRAYQDAAVRVEAYLRERCELTRSLLTPPPPPPDADPLPDPDS